ncbi:hypothetical protein [Halorubrum sp. AS12]|uniref:hypothetical protein n=1 Tax=Halorubrum sp. AS12 TaxID=3409687 RepID=UPI003DA7334F
MGDEEDTEESSSSRWFPLEKNLSIFMISLFVSGAGFVVAATLLEVFVEGEIVNAIRLSLYLTGVAFGGLVTSIEFLIRISE